MRTTSSMPTKSMLPLIIRTKPSLFESHRSKYGLFIRCTSGFMLPILQLKPCSSRACTSALIGKSGIYNIFSPSSWQLLFVFHQQFDKRSYAKACSSSMVVAFLMRSFLHPCSTSDVNMHPRDIGDEVRQECCSSDRTTRSASNVLDVCIVALDLLVIFIIQRKLPHLFSCLIRSLAQPVYQLLVADYYRGYISSKCNYSRASECS